jgi:hypothetical protein
MKALLTPVEVVRNTNLPKEFPPFELKDIRTIEYSFFMDNLSIKLYNEMLEAKLPVTGIVEWSQASHAAGDVVKREGVIYEALETTTTRPPTDSWKIRDKFSNECYSDIWCNGFLAELLSFMVLQARLPFIANNIHAEGVGTSNSTFTKATQKGYDVTASGVDASIGVALKNFKDYVNNQNKCLNLPNITDGCGITEQVDINTSIYKVA